MSWSTEQAEYAASMAEYEGAENEHKQWLDDIGIHKIEKLKVEYGSQYAELPSPQLFMEKINEIIDVVNAMEDEL